MFNTLQKGKERVAVIINVYKFNDFVPLFGDNLPMVKDECMSRFVTPCY
jgi:hypothetical protein